MESAPIITHACHCLMCQKASGSAFRVNAMIEADRLSITQGTPEPYHGAGSLAVVRCPDCGFALWSHHPRLGQAIAFVGVGMLDEGARLRPEAHYFTRSKHPWVVLPEDVPAFEQLGDPGKPGAGARIAAALGGRAGGPPR